MKKIAFSVLAAALLLSGCNLTARSAAGPTLAPASGQLGITAGLAGASVGKSLSGADRRIALEAEYQALEHTQGGKPVSWKSARGGASGDVVAAQPYRVGSQDCRQYTHTVFEGADAQTARGTACRNPDGTWTRLT